MRRITAEIVQCAVSSLPKLPFFVLDTNGEKYIVEREELQEDPTSISTNELEINNNDKNELEVNNDGVNELQINNGMYNIH